MHAQHATAPRLFADRGCPFAHRVLALLEQLDLALELSESPVGQKPEGLEKWSPSGRIPLLVHGDVVIGESRVIMEYLAEAYAFESAYPSALVERTMHRHAMAIVDDFVTPRLFREDAIADARIEECLDVLQRVTDASRPVPCLLVFHLAPLWLRFKWWRPESAVTAAIARRKDLATWLDGATHLPAVQRTAPSRAEIEALRAELRSS
jgi:glutathione S-transferase